MTTETSSGLPAADVAVVRDLAKRLAEIAALPVQQERVAEWDIEPTKLDQQAQVLDVRLTVLAVVVVPPRGRREPARSLVEADGVGRHADLSREFTDPHDGRKPWSGSNVKRAPDR